MSSLTCEAQWPYAHQHQHKPSPCMGAHATHFHLLNCNGFLLHCRWLPASGRRPLALVGPILPPLLQGLLKPLLQVGLAGVLEVGRVAAADVPDQAAPHLAKLHGPPLVLGLGAQLVHSADRPWLPKVYRASRLAWQGIGTCVRERVNGQVVVAARGTTRWLLPHSTMCPPAHPPPTRPSRPPLTLILGAVLGCQSSSPCNVLTDACLADQTAIRRAEPFRGPTRAWLLPPPLGACCPPPSSPVVFAARIEQLAVFLRASQGLLMHEHRSNALCGQRTARCMVAPCPPRGPPQRQQAAHPPVAPSHVVRRCAAWI